MAEDARVRKTKQKLSAALVELLQEKGFNDITPAQICEKAGINRSTFYRNYKNTTQLKNEMENKILNGILWSEPVETDTGTAQLPAGKPRNVPGTFFCGVPGGHFR